MYLRATEMYGVSDWIWSVISYVLHFAFGDNTIKVSSHVIDRQELPVSFLFLKPNDQLQ